MVSSATDKNISFRSQLTGELSDFLQDENFACSETTAVLVALVAALSHYKEEGIVLSPEIYICNDITKVTSLLQGVEFIKIGHGKHNAKIAIKILKECAPLAQNGWSIFIEQLSEEFVYGVFTASNLPLALTPDEVLVGEDDESFPVVIISKLADNCVEVSGARGNRRCIHFSAVREDSPSPKDAIDKLAKSITLHVNNKYRSNTYRFVYKTLSNIFQQPHGALVVVLKRRCRKLPQSISDAVSLAKPILLVNRVSDFLTLKDNEAMIKLQATTSILAGMIHSDGIVVFRSDGAILGYRAFLNNSSHKSIAHENSGGARRRTYEALKKLVDKQNIMGVFFRSQDGYAEYYGRLDNE